MPNPINKALEEFRKEFLMKDSECTWEGYPLPEQIEDFWIFKLKQVIRETEIEVINKMKSLVNELEPKGAVISFDDHGNLCAWKIEDFLKRSTNNKDS